MRTSEPLVPIDDLARYLTVSVSTVRSWVRKNQIPRSAYMKIGNTYRFCMSDVINALDKKDIPEDVPAVPAVPVVEVTSAAPVQLELDFDADQDV